MALNDYDRHIEPKFNNDQALWKDTPHGRIQWKGTDVCMDIHCSCGELTHVDGEFCCYVKCGKCGKGWMMSPNVKLIELDPEAHEFIENEEHIPFTLSHA